MKLVIFVSVMFFFFQSYGLRSSEAFGIVKREAPANVKNQCRPSRLKKISANKAVVKWICQGVCRKDGGTHYSERRDGYAHSTLQLGDEPGAWYLLPGTSGPECIDGYILAATEGDPSDQYNYTEFAEAPVETNSYIQ